MVVAWESSRLSFILFIAIAARRSWFYGQHLYTKDGPATADGGARIIVMLKGATVQTAIAAS